MNSVPLKSIVCSREDLYKQVWEKPMIKLAQEYGLSDNGLRKLCKRYNIPIPNVGYWQKVQNGRKTRKKPLPEFSDNNPITITPTPIEKVDPAIPSFISNHDILKNKIILPDKLIKPDPLILETKNNLIKSYNHKGYLINSKGIDIRVSPEKLNKALLILDTLIKIFNELGWAVLTNEGTRFHPTYVIIEGEKVNFDLIERQKIEKKIRTTWGDQTLVYIPSGILVLRMICEWGPEKSWGDRKTKRVEDCLNSFIENLYLEAQKMKKFHLEKEREAQERKERELREQELKRLKDIEIAKINDLIRNAYNWNKSKLIREYINETTKVYIGKYGASESGGDFDQWVVWATKKADQIDPLTVFRS